MQKQKILFLCTGNSCRSQMAEAWCRALKSDQYEAYSAGTIAKGLNPKMVQVMLHPENLWVIGGSGSAPS